MRQEDVKTLKKGDTVRVSFNAKVTGNGGRFSVYAEDANGNLVYLIDKEAAASDGYTGSEDFPFGQVDITLVKKADPECWPPKAGDVWRGKSDKEYHFLGNGNLAWDHDKNLVNSQYVIKDEPFLVHRRVVK